MSAVTEPAYRRLFGQWLQRVRRANRLTQADLAAQANCTPGYVALVESGRRRASDQYLERVAKPLHMDLDELKEQRALADSLEQLRGVAPADQKELASLVSERLPSRRRSGGRRYAGLQSWTDLSMGDLQPDGPGVMALAMQASGPRRKTLHEQRLEELVAKAEKLTQNQLERLIAYLDGLVEGSDPPRSRRRQGRSPDLPAGQPISAYTDPELVTLIRWIESDGLPRTEDELMATAMTELGFQRLGREIRKRLLEAIRAARP